MNLKLYKISQIEELERQPADLIPPQEKKQLTKDLPVLSEITNWIKNFLGKPHAESGHDGSVCPFIPIALELDTLILIIIHIPKEKKYTKKYILEVLLNCRSQFLSLLPTEGPNKYFKAFLCIFPDYKDDEINILIDVTKKLGLEGLMVGTLFPENVAKGLHNPKFHPSKSPFPLIIIRFRVKGDYMFDIHGKGLTNEKRFKNLTLALKLFGSTMNKKELALVHSELERLAALLNRTNFS